MVKGEQITLGPFLEDHSLQYWAWVNESEVATAVTRALPVTPAEHKRWYDSCIARSDAVFFSVCCKETGEYWGNVWLWGITPVHRTAELRILLGPDAPKGRGIGTEACRLLLQFAFERLNLNKVYLYVWEKNEAARSTFRKAGFKDEGRMREEWFLEGEYQDGYRMAVLRRNYTASS